MLDLARARLQAEGESIDEYMLSMIEMKPEAEEEEETEQKEEPEAATTAATAAPSSTTPSPSAPASLPPSSAASSSCVASSSSSSSFSSSSSSVCPCPGDCLVVRLWHSAVFLGARETANGDPGALCKDWHFAPRTAEFRHLLTMEQTDAIMQAEEDRVTKGHTKGGPAER